MSRERLPDPHPKSVAHENKSVLFLSPKYAQQALNIRTGNAGAYVTSELILVALAILVVDYSFKLLFFKDFLNYVYVCAYVCMRVCLYCVCVCVFEHMLRFLQ